MNHNLATTWRATCGGKRYPKYGKRFFSPALGAANDYNTRLSWGLVLALRVKVNLIHQLLPNKTVTATAVDAEKESSLENQSRLTLELSSFRDGSVRGSGLPRGYTQHKTSSTSSVKLSSASSGLMLAEESCASPEYDA